MRENITPGNRLPIIVNDVITINDHNTDNNGDSAVSNNSGNNSYKSTVSVIVMFWGLIPSYTTHTQSVHNNNNFKPNFYNLFNKRIESFFSMGYFQNLLMMKEHRCVAVIDGFYEWKDIGGKKQPHYVYFEDNQGNKQPMKIAAIAENINQDITSCNKN